MSVLFFAKLALAPTIVASGTMASRRWGHQVGGLVAGFPNTSSPILFFLAFERGADFAASAAVGTLLGLVALAAYGWVYVWSAKRWPWTVALPLGWAAYLSVAWCLRKAEVPVGLATLLAVGALVMAVRCMPRLPEPAAGQASRGWEVPVRMGAAILLLVGLTGAAGWLGPNLSGVMSAFPIASSVLTAGAHRDAGAAGAERVLKGIFTALMALIRFTALVPLLLSALPIVPAFALAAAAGFAAQGGLLWRRRDLAHWAGEA